MINKHNATLRGKSNSEGQIKLQLFASGAEGDAAGASDPGAAEGNPGGEGEGGDAASKNYTQAEYEAELQKETDRRVSSALAKAKLDFEAKLEDEKEEAAKLAQLSESEKQQAIFDKQQREFEQQKGTFERERLELEVTKQLASKSLPTQFAPLLVDADADSSFKNISAFETSWQEALEKAVEDRLKSKSPLGGGSGGEAGAGIGARLAKQRSESNQEVKVNPYF